jgi:hypothetical protein
LVVDQKSKIVKLISCNKETTAKKIATLYMKYIYNYGLPVSIVSNQNTRFDSKFWKVLWKLTETTLHIEVARYPETDGQAEWTIQTIKQMIRMNLNKVETNWLK